MMKMRLKRQILLFALMASFARMSYADKPFTLVDTTGVIHRLTDYKGKWVIVNYWATWCPPCLEEVPDLVNLYDQRRDKDLMVLGVIFEFKHIREVETFVDDMLMSYPIVLGNQHVVAQIGSAAVLPTTYIYNPQGRLVKVKKGLMTKQDIEALMASGRP
jgi:thiol-disulfide isomerase/thioredoxin